MPILEVKNLTVRYGNLTIVDNVSFSLEQGRWLMIIGPNGAGKSTIAKAITQGVDYTGQVLWEGMDIKQMKPTEIAKRIGVLTQSHLMGYSFTVEEVVRLGRYSYAPGIFSPRDDQDIEQVEAALEKTGLAKLRNQSILTLSGGELQRTFLAQIFAQDPLLLLLDEPTNHLDLLYQKQVLGLIRDWIRTTGRTVVSVVHDLSLAKAYGTDALLINKGKLVTVGAIEEVLTRENLHAVYDMDVNDWMCSLLGQWQG
ncbi:MAG: ABC transporter ATP-binding protein [Saccharofermentanales bacterium]|jgi:iron complex transport system ATP-binding protein|nr:ABC transporter ATP-binding protein [Bacillota bacterium]NLB08243.1 ABC transporter ATP-binding protein [Clostridiales bacterium]